MSANEATLVPFIFCTVLGPSVPSQPDPDSVLAGEAGEAGEAG